MYLIALCDLLHEYLLGLPLSQIVLHVLLLQFLQVLEQSLRLLVLALRVKQPLLFPFLDLMLDHFRTPVYT